VNSYSLQSFGLDLFLSALEWFLSSHTNEYKRLHSPSLFLLLSSVECLCSATVAPFKIEVKTRLRFLVLQAIPHNARERKNYNCARPLAARICLSDDLIRVEYKPSRKETGRRLITSANRERRPSTYAIQTRVCYKASDTVTVNVNKLNIVLLL